jgi:ribose 5-phosphate isomerase B
MWGGVAVSGVRFAKLRRNNREKNNQNNQMNSTDPNNHLLHTAHCISHIAYRIASDHAGFELKQFILSQCKDFHWKDEGCLSLESVDYPDFAHPVADFISKHPLEKGVLICGSGNGMQMTANKHPNVRAALCWSPEIAALARLHNDANILVLPARFISNEEALAILSAFFETPFEGGRHEKRVEKINLKV